MASIVDMIARTRRGLGITFFLISWGFVHAQQVYPVWVTPTPSVFTAATVYLEDFAHLEATAGRINFILELRDPVEPFRQVHFRLHIERNGTTVLMTDPAFLPPVITLQKGQPIMINGSDLAFYFDIRHLIGFSGFEISNVLPEDYYSICIEVIDFVRQEPISEKTCIRGFLNQLSPPLLYLPQNNVSLNYGQSTNLMFHWQLTGISLLFQSNISYDFQLRELTPGVNPQDEFENNTLIYNTTVRNYSLVYGPFMPPLLQGKTYIWRVRAFAKDNTGMEIPGYFHNNGFSEVWQFNLPNDTESEGEFCNTRLPKQVQNQIPIRQLSVSDVVHIGHFDLTITQLENGSGSNAKGKGKILIPFLKISIETSFDSLSVNNKKFAFAGRINAVNEDGLLSKLKGNPDGTLNFGDAGSFSEADISRITSFARLNSPTSTFSLPLSLKTRLNDLFSVKMPSDLIVNEMSFTPSGAKFSAFMLVPDGTGGYARFGASNIDIDNAGLNLSDLHLFLAENTSMRGFDRQPIQILSKGNKTNAEDGSYISFDCSGFKEYNLQGRYVFEKSRLVKASNSSLPASATFTINTPAWDDFMATASMPDFAIPGMDGWRFEVINALADFNKDENTDNMQLPDGDDGSGSKWKGFYIKEFKVTTPQELKFGSADALEMLTKNLVIDSQGVSCSAVGYNLLRLATGNAGGWGLSFDEMQLNILKNVFLDAGIKGKIIVAPIGDTIVFNGKIFIDDQTDQYALDLIPIGGAGLPFLKGNIDFKKGSLVSIRKQTPFCVSEWNPYASLNVSLNMNMKESDFIKLGGVAISDIMARIKTELGSPGEFTFDVAGLTIDGFKINHPNLPQGRHFGFDKFSISDGSIVLAGVNVDLGGLDLLEEEFELNGMKKGLGLSYHLSSGSYGIKTKFWALDNGISALSPFSFAKIEMNFPKVLKQLFHCECTPPEQGKGLPDYCQAPVSPVETSLLQIGQKVKIGHFTMEVSTLFGKSGTGKIDLPFLGNELAVNFSNIQLDDHGLMTGGKVQTAISASFPDISEDAQKQTPGPLSLARITDQGGFMEKMTSHMNEIGELITFPVSISSMVHNLVPGAPIDHFDFILLGINFDSAGAKVNCMAIFKTPEGKYLKFGIAGINIRPDGFDLKELKLFLTEEVTIPVFDNRVMRLLKSNTGDPGSGSYISFDCDGFKEFNLKAGYSFDKSMLVNAGNKVLLADALLNINTPTWGNFTATATIPAFTIPELDGWSFEVLEAGADFAIDKNLQDMQFPTGYHSTGLDWEGFYVKSLKVNLPDDLKFGSRNHLEMAAENLIIDRQGVWCATKGFNLLSLETALTGGWNFSIRELQLNMMKNHFVDAQIKGDAAVQPLNVLIKYEGKIFKEPATKVEPNSFYAMDISPIGIFNVDFLNVNFTVGDGSHIALRKRPKLDVNGHPVIVKHQSVFRYKPYVHLNAFINLDFQYDRVGRFLNAMGYGKVSAVFNQIGLHNPGFREEIEIKNLQIKYTDVFPGIHFGLQGYKLTKHFITHRSDNLWK